MADALPDSQAQLESLRAFTKDLELSVRTSAKGYGSKAVQLPELRRWLDAALASNSDDALRPEERWSDGAYVVGAARKKVMQGLLDRVKERVAALEARSVEAKETSRDWLITQLTELATGVAQVPEAKGGGTHAASVDEVKAWLAAPGPAPKLKMKD